MKTLTVFTPTYNRAYCLGQLYDSLQKQTSRDFVWLIIDDGSTDGTEALVRSWISEAKVDIEYVYQQNQGMHGAHNTAYAQITTVLNTCIDSDDFMPLDAVENILRLWEEKGSAQWSGMVGLDAYKDGSIVGSKIPELIRTSTLNGLYRQGVTGDKKLVLRTEVVRQFPPYPLFEGERFVPLGTLYQMIDQQYELLCSNDVYCIVEYLEDGSSRNIFKQYRRNPRGFAYARLLEMRYSKSFLYTFKKAMHLVSSALFSRRYDIFRNNPQRFVTLLAVPFGILLHVYISLKSKP